MRKVLFLMIFAGLAFGCSKTKPSTPPSAASLIFPDNNAACISGTVVSDTQNTVPFSWHGTANTNSYKLHVKNLLTNGITTFNTNNPGLIVTLLRNTPYSWYVESQSSQVTTTATSDTWKFYNSGPGIVSHPPLPADPGTPAFGALVTASSGGTVSLAWYCVDVDGDLVSFDIYFGTSGTPSLFQSDVMGESLAVPVTSGHLYYWMVVAKDSKGNTSTSSVSQFLVN